jgi:hypothetical protein
MIIFSQIKLTRPDKFSAVARSSPRPICPGGTALLSNPRVQDFLHPRIDVFPYKERYVILCAFAAHPKLFA